MVSDRGAGTPAHEFSELRSRSCAATVQAVPAGYCNPATNEAYRRTDIQKSVGTILAFLRPGRGERYCDAASGLQCELRRASGRDGR